MVLRYQLHVLHRQVKRPVLKPHDRVLLAVAPSRRVTSSPGGTQSCSAS